MSTSLPLKISRSARSTAPARSVRQTRTWHLAVLWERTGLLGIVALSAALNIVWLNREAYGNTYYAAAVKSMGTSWPAFFYASFDAGGFVTVDKPPVGLWVQAASVKLFGFSGLSLLLPQAIAGVLSVVLLWWLVRRAYGPAAGLIAGLALAVTPISVVTFRNNTMDGQLILVLLLAVWAGSLAAEQGRLRLLLLCAALVGLGYNVKMLQAFLVLPALWGAYLLWAPVRQTTRLAHLTVATLVLLVVSLSWSLVVDLTPPAARPYIGSSGSNSALSLALGYNGLGRVTQAIATHLSIPGIDGLTVDLTAAPGFAPGIGNPGPLRLFSTALADQASWLLPLALVGLLLAAWQQVRPPRRLDALNVSRHDRQAGRRARVALAVWGLWLAVCLGYFSAARFYHVYYLIMLGPAIAALAGIGVAAGWRAYRAGRASSWLLPLFLVGSSAMQAVILLPYADWRTWLTPLVLGVASLTSVVLLLSAYLLRGSAPGVRLATFAAVTGCLSLMVAPGVWSVISVWNNNGAAWLPEAGPSGGRGFMGFPGGSGSQGGPGGGFRNVAPPQNGSAPAFTVPPGFGGPAGGNRGPQTRASGQGQGGGFGPGNARGGPGGFGGPGGGPRGGQMALTFAGDQWDNLDPGLVQYLLARQGAARFLVATPTSTYASLFILATDQPAMALGGYQGWDRVVTPDQLSALVDEGVVRFFWINGAGNDGGGSRRPGAMPPGPAGGFGQLPASSSQDMTGDLLAWVRGSCSAVPASEWQPGTVEAARQETRGYQLYDCAS